VADGYREGWWGNAQANLIATGKKSLISSEERLSALSRESSATLHGVLGEMSRDLTHNGILTNSENGTAFTRALE
jgi:hypothetical protein